MIKVTLKNKSAETDQDRIVIVLTGENPSHWNITNIDNDGFHGPDVHDSLITASVKVSDMISDLGMSITDFEITEELI